VFPPNEAVAVDRTAWESLSVEDTDVAALRLAVLPPRLEELCEEPVARPEETAVSNNAGCAGAAAESWLTVTGTAATVACGSWTAVDTMAVWRVSDCAFLLEWAARAAPDASVVASAASFVPSVFDPVCPIFAEVNWLAGACARMLPVADCPMPLP
jgi:hypothetical protein